MTELTVLDDLLREREIGNNMASKIPAFDGRWTRLLIAIDARAVTIRRTCPRKAVMTGVGRNLERRRFIILRGGCRSRLVMVRPIPTQQFRSLTRAMRVGAPVTKDLSRVAARESVSLTCP